MAKDSLVPKRQTPEGDPLPANAPKLSEEARIYVVTALALWRPEAEILKRLAEEFTPPGAKPVSQQALWSYNPANPHCPPRWKKLHAETREAWTKDLAEVGAYHQKYRVSQLHRMSERALEKGNFVLSAALLKQAAEDLGGSYTNRRDLTTAGEKIEPGGSVYVNPVVSAMDLDAAGEAQLREVLRKALEPVEDKAPKDGAVRGRRSPSKS